MAKPRMGQVVTEAAFPMLLKYSEALEKNPQGIMGNIL